MERKIESFTGTEFSNFIQGVINQDGSRTYTSYEFRWEPNSTPTGAVNRAKRMSGNPNFRPVAFKIPSAIWDHTTKRAQHIDFVQSRPDYYNANEEEKFQLINPSKYVVNGWTYLGGNVDDLTATINNVDIGSDIYINDTTFESVLMINYLISNYYLRFSNCRFKDTVHLMYVQIDEVSFNNCQFDSNLFITNCDINKFTVEAGSKAKDISIKSDKIESYGMGVLQNDIPHKIGKIQFDDIIITEKLDIGGKNIDNIIFRKVVSNETNIVLEQPFINVSGDNKKHFIKKLNYTCTASETPSKYSLSDLSLGTFELRGLVNSDDAFTVMSCDIKKFYVQEFSNTGKFVLNDVSISDELLVEKSDLAEALFIGVKLRNIKQCEITRSNITDIVLYNTSFSDNINEKVESLYDIRDIYRQLKYASSKQNDRINELRYEAIESSIIRKILEQNNDKDKWIFRLNDWTSKHGQDWVLAGKVLLLTALVLFLAIQWLMGYTDLAPQNALENVANFILFINPIHKFSDLFGSQDTEWRKGLAMFIDAVFKLVSAYMIFQFLRAFRKYFRS